MEAIPKDETDQARRYRGYIAIDDLFFDVGDACQGHCTFDSGMCGFLNDNTKDDFDWQVVSVFLRPRAIVFCYINLSYLLCTKGFNTSFLGVV